MRIFTLKTVGAIIATGKGELFAVASVLSCSSFFLSSVSPWQFIGIEWGDNTPNLSGLSVSRKRTNGRHSHLSQERAKLPRQDDGGLSLNFFSRTNGLELQLTIRKEKAFASLFVARQMIAD